MLAAREAAPDAPITLLAHSAGGWMGRVWLLQRFDELMAEGAKVDCYVSLGSPQLPPPPDVVDQTRGILTWCAANCPGGLHEGLKYVTVAGEPLAWSRAQNCDSDFVGPEFDHGSLPPGAGRRSVHQGCAPDGPRELAAACGGCRVQDGEGGGVSRQSVHQRPLHKEYPHCSSHPLHPETPVPTCACIRRYAAMPALGATASLLCPQHTCLRH